MGWSNIYIYIYIYIYIRTSYFQNSCQNKILKRLSSKNENMIQSTVLYSSIADSKLEPIVPFQRFIKLLTLFNGGARGVIVIVVGNGHGDSSSNPGRD